MSEAVELVARALFKHDVERERPFSGVDYVRMIYGDPPCAWEQLCQTAQDDFREQARAAIAGLREPTEAMCEAGDDAVDAPTHRARYVWPAMIDAALADG